MKWDNKYKWHNWFAWYPVNVDGVSYWLETVKRKKHYLGGYSYAGAK